MSGFQLSINTKLVTQSIKETEPIRRAVSRFYRDMEMTLEPSPGAEESRIILCQAEAVTMEPESYLIRVEDEVSMILEAVDELGFIYGLIAISETYLGVLPFWFWNDQKFLKKPMAYIPAGEYQSKPRRVTFRGWFINDEVLISHWDAGKNREYPWEMAMEALLRCGGNLVIPGTDKNSKQYARLASSMGLWLTHHHAEPLGAEMFLRAYPDLEPSFQRHPELFRNLWREGIRRQKDQNIIWNLGFRGQGDVPFWEHDPQYDTPKKRGQLISSIMREQYELVRAAVENPRFCTNLYGETMELYRQGCLEIPEDVITIWADNGYGKMVSRRQGNHNPRVPALPAEEADKTTLENLHGVYYHVSFYDLQAANVLTTIPNSMEFVERELEHAYARNIRAMWLVNCSNIKPHVYPLDFLASLWNDRSFSAQEHLEHYLQLYYPQGGQSFMQDCVKSYFNAMIPYGEREDEHAGEQFYHYVTRILISHWRRDGGQSGCEELQWCAPDGDFAAQIHWFTGKCHSGLPALYKLLETCTEAGRQNPLWQDSFLLQAKIHAYSAQGAVLFGDAYDACVRKEYLEAFYLLGQAADTFALAQKALEESGHGKWLGFYDNDCQTDIKQTVYLLRQLMGYVRNLGEGPYFYHWQRLVLNSRADRGIFLLTNEENHMTDENLYRGLREKRTVHNEESVLE